MNSFDTLIFPDTDILKEEYYPLLLLCSPLHFLQLVETTPGTKADQEVEHYSSHGLLRAHTPAPLGDNRQAYLDLIDDIRDNKYSYVNELKTLTTQSGPAARGVTPNSDMYDFICSLLKKYGIALKDIDSQLELWQSRLVLSLAEMLTKETDELEEDISYFDEEEMSALRLLTKADGANQGDISNEVRNFKNQTKKTQSGFIKKRFDAWLYLMQQQPLPQVKLWLASTRIAGDQLLQRYESATGKHAVPVQKIALPAHISASDKYVVKQVEAFQGATKLIHRGLTADFERITTTVPYVDSPESLLPYGTDWADQWETMLYDYFPAGENGRQNITMYLLPNQQIQQFAGPFPTTEEDAVTSLQRAHDLLGILAPA